MYARRMHRGLPTRLALLVAIALPGAAAAQVPSDTRLPLAAADARVFLLGLGQDPVTAEGLGVPVSALPRRAPGVVGGVHVYPLRLNGFAIGIGGELLLARGVATFEDDAGTTTRIEQRLQSLAVSASANFGDYDGWSYLSAGMGPLRFESFTGDAAPAEPARRRATINLGGGARWFTTAHLAVGFDVRFYITRSEPATAVHPGRQRDRLLVLSAGLSFQ